jgi:DNA invertase Pin-like site-specific DNA recombinase
MQPRLYRHRQRSKVERPSLAEALSYLREGDVVAVWKLDLLGDP